MKPLHLGIDLDNTLVDTLAACLRCFNRFTGQTVTTAQCTTYAFYEIYGWDEATYHDAYARFGEEIHRTAQPIDGALPVVRALARHHRISIVTARPDAYFVTTLAWLHDYAVPYEGISFASDKLTCCRRLGIDLLIDDTPAQALAFAAAGAEMLLLDQPYNRHVDHPCVRRVRNWAEVAQAVGPPVSESGG